MTQKKTVKELGTLFGARIYIETNDTEIVMRAEKYLKMLYDVQFEWRSGLLGRTELKILSTNEKE